MRNYSAKEVDDYIASAAKEARPKLKELRLLIRATVPKAEEGISWGIPFYKYCGLVAGFATFKNHVGFGFADRLTDEDREALEAKGYSTGKKTIQIKFDQKVPSTVIKRLLKAKAKANEEKREKK